MIEQAYYNGIYLPYEEAAIPLSDRSIFFGDGVYDLMIGENNKVYQQQKHLNRLFSSAAAIDLQTEGVKKEITEAIEKIVCFSERMPFVLYVQISRKSKKRQHKYDSVTLPNVLITLTSREDIKDAPPVKLSSAQDKRYQYCNIKTLNLLPNIISLNYAISNESDECVFLKDGIVTECTHSNIMIIKDGIVFTHPDCNCILPGITKSNLIGVCHSLSIGISETAFSYDALLDADEILITSTTKFARRCSSVDSIPTGFKDGYTAEKIISSLKIDYFSTIE